VSGTIRGLLESGTALGATDGELLGRFVGRRDEAAFAALVERHGPMVLRACRSLLGDDHDALDAFQATFLVLARKGGSLWVRDSLGPWLHRVARRAANRARRDRDRRRAAERRAAEAAPSRSVALEPGRDDLAAAVQEEVDRLPERFRVAVVLCELEGLTSAEAAATLGLPVGTVASRLSRGRDRLRDRLRRRGLDPKAGAAPVVLPAGLAEATASAAARFLPTTAAPPGVAAALAIGVLRAMSRNDVWRAAALALALGASTSGVLALAARGGASEEPPPAAPPEKAAAKPEAAEVRPGVVLMPVLVDGNVAATRREPVRLMLLPTSPFTVAIRSILPSGTRVKKGDVVVELDSGLLRKALVAQTAAASQARIRFQAADQACEIAKMALDEYKDGIYPAAKAGAQGAVQAAESAVASSEKRAERVQRLREESARLLEKRGDAATPADVLADQEMEDRLDLARLGIQKDRLELEQARAKLAILEDYTRDKDLKMLQAEWNKAQAERFSRVAEEEREKSQLVALERFIAKASIPAPVDGVVDISQLPGTGWPRPGTHVQGGQVVAYIQQDDGRLVVNAEVPDETASRIRPGLRAKVTIAHLPARAGAVLDGVVESIEAQPSPSLQPTLGGPAPETNLAVIDLQDPPAGAKPVPLRPGASVRVKFLIDSGPDALGVPRRGLVWYDGAYHVGVRKADGAVEWREVVTGLYNDDVAEVRSGLEPGEAVVADPDPLLSDDQRRRVAIAPPPPPDLPPILWQESGGMGRGFE